MNDLEKWMNWEDKPDRDPNRPWFSYAPPFSSLRSFPDERYEQANAEYAEWAKAKRELNRKAKRNFSGEENGTGSKRKRRR